MKKGTVYFPALDGLRAIACIFVLVAHLIWHNLSPFIVGQDWYQNSVIGKGLTYFFLKNGGLGVRIFFVLSGFLITYLMLVEKREKARVNLGHFYFRRVLRIWPLYLIVIAFVFIAYPLLHKIFLGSAPVMHEQVGYYLGFLGNFDVMRIATTPGTYANGMSALTWSISIEEQFYFIWPWVFVLLAGKGLEKGILFILTISIAFAFFLGSKQEVVYFHTQTNFMFLAGGSLLAVSFFNKRGFYSVVEKLKTFSRISIIAVLIFFLIFFNELFSAISFAPALYALLSLCLALFIIADQLIHPSSSYNLSRFKILVKGGKYTYGLYMYHLIINWVLLRSLGSILEPGLGRSILIILAGLALSGLVSWLSFHFLEKKILALRNRYPFEKTSFPILKESSVHGK